MSELPAPPSPAPDTGPGAPPPHPPPPPPSRPPTARRVPRAGELTLGWRFVVAGIWCGVAVAFAAIWSASVQLGLSTWWLGPRSDPRSALVRIGPFVPAVLMIIAALNNARWLCWWGLGAAGVLGLVAIGDLGRVSTLAAVELAVAIAAGAVSIASFTGTYRRVEARTATAGTATSTPQR